MPEAAAITNGIKKCNVKNRVRVALFSANPPHTQLTSLVPAKGMADNKFVITVAPQKDIWPHGRTYPKNAVPIVRNKIITPIIQVGINKYDL